MPKNLFDVDGWLGDSRQSYMYSYSWRRWAGKNLMKRCHVFSRKERRKMRGRKELRGEFVFSRLHRLVVPCL